MIADKHHALIYIGTIANHLKDDCSKQNVKQKKRLDMIYVILCFIILWIILVIANKKKLRPSNPSSDSCYWEDFRTRKPTEAKEIEEITRRDMSCLDSKSTRQIVTSLIRWSQISNVSIGELKANYLEEVKKSLSQGNNFETLISRLKDEKIKEARQYGISQDFTICNFMIEIIDEYRQEKTSDDLSSRVSRNIGEQLNMTPDEIEQLTKSIQSKEKELNLAPDISRLDREENKLFALAEEGARMLDNITIGISNRAKLSKSGFAEARILCSTLVIDLHSNFKNEIDMDIQTDRYFLLLADATLFDTENIDNNIEYINSRIAFYKEQVSIARLLTPLQLIQPNNALAKIFNAIYLHPGCKNPGTIKSDEVTTNDVIMFRGPFEKVIRHLKVNRDKICGTQIENEGDRLQSEIEEALMLLFPESEHSQVSQDIAYLMTDTMLAQLKQGNLDSAITAIMSPDIRNKFSHVATEIQRYSVHHNDIESIIEEAQLNVTKKFNL